MLDARGACAALTFVGIGYWLAMATLPQSPLTTVDRTQVKRTFFVDHPQTSSAQLSGQKLSQPDLAANPTKCPPSQRPAVVVSAGALPRAALPKPPLTSFVPEWLVYFQQRAESEGRRLPFLQIGANDGVRNDPLYPTLSKDKQKFIGLQVEPTPDLFASVERLHADAPDWRQWRGVVSPQCDADGTMTFFRADVEGYKKKMGKQAVSWIAEGQVNALSMNPHLKKLDGLGLLFRDKVPCLSSVTDLLETAASSAFLAAAAAAGRGVECAAWNCSCVGLTRLTGLKHKVTWGKATGPHRSWWVMHACGGRNDTNRGSVKRYRIGVLQIDIEGHDVGVLSLLDFSRVRPAVINFESKCVLDLDWAKSFLSRNGYWVQTTGSDTMAVDILMDEDPDVWWSHTSAASFQHLPKSRVMRSGCADKTPVHAK